MALPGNAPGDRFATINPRPARVVESTYRSPYINPSPPEVWSGNKQHFVGSTRMRAIESAYRSPLPTGRYLQVLPDEDYSALQDPFDWPVPPTKTYTIKNTGALSLDYSITTGDLWVTVSEDTGGPPGPGGPGGPPGPGGLTGTLAPGEEKSILVTLNSNVFDVGWYESSVSFVNTTDFEGGAEHAIELAVGQGVVIETSLSGFTATMVGYTEYTSPSSPPVYYRRKDFSGGITYCQYNGGALCSLPTNGAEVRSYSGACSYAADGTFTSTALYTLDTNYVPGTCAAGGVITHPSWGTCTIPDKYDAFDGGLNYVNLTQTTREVIGLGICATVGGGFGYKATGSATETLSNPDTNADAIARGRATQTWTPYASAGSESDPSKWETRTGGSFLYRDARIRATMTAYRPVTHFNLTLDVMRSVYDAGVYVKIGEIVLPFVTDGTGSAVITDYVLPAYEGYDVKVANPVVTRA